jgi:hypothetical protein
MRLPLNEQFVSWARKSGLEETLVQGVREWIDHRRNGQPLDQFFRRLSSGPTSAKGYWARAVAAEKDKIKDPRAFVKFLRLLKPHIEIDVRTEPWNRWQRGSQVLVVVGKRDVSIPEVSASVKQRAVGARDSEAFAELSRVLHGDLGLNCEIVLEHLPARLSNEEAAARLQRWRSRKSVGMICVLGSPVVNPLANVIARSMLISDGKKEPDEPPIKFRWAYEVGTDNFLADQDIPGRRRMWDASEEGVAFPRAPATFSRVSDDTVQKRLRRTQGFADAGIFMMDCRQRPILVLCAGHGGTGTVGCVRQLREAQLIDDLLEAARAPSSKMRDRIVAAVEINRRRGRSGGGGVDDLEIVSAQMAWASSTPPGRVWRDSAD